MATEAPLLALRDAGIGFGGAPLFEGISLGINRRDRICLVGRNGSGKSTLLKLLSGELEPDSGERFVQPGTRVGRLAQQPRFDPQQSVVDYVTGADDHGPEPHEVAAVLDRLSLEPERRMGSLSGGEARRADLARLLATRPDVLLLDEPTNHLDLPTIEWLEEMLRTWPGAMLVISHDRRFLANLTTRVLWLDRGRLRTSDRGFAHFDEWAESVLAEEESAAQRLKTMIAAEERWRERGVTARRRRNQGRLQRLGQLRAERAALLDRKGQVEMTAASGTVRSRVTIEAKGIAKSFGGPDGERPVVREFSSRILRGDKVGIIGPNGAGKTTLLRMLTGELEPDRGEVRRAPNLVVAYFDQHRQSLSDDDTLWQALCPDGGDTVWVQGRPMHVVGYLKEFLFEPEQARSPVSSLSGGERNRLLLAKILAQPSDLLVLDEPTNDLDIETLDLLEEVLADYAGTLLLVSHDRDFLDRVVTSVIAFEGNGVVREYPGGYSDYLRQRRPAEATATPRPRRAASAPGTSRAQSARLGYKEQRELDLLPKRMEELTKRIRELEAALADSGLYARDPERFVTLTERLEAEQAALAEAEERWLELEEKRERLAGGAR